MSQEVWEVGETFGLEVFGINRPMNQISVLKSDGS